MNKDDKIKKLEIKKKLKESYADGQNNVFAVMQPKIDALQLEIVDLKNQLKDQPKQIFDDIDNWNFEVFEITSNQIKGKSGVINALDISKMVKSLKKKWIKNKEVK